MDTLKIHRIRNVTNENMRYISLIVLSISIHLFVGGCKSIQLFPTQNEYILNCYSDNFYDNGLSTIDNCKLTDSTFKVEFTLRKKFNYPYAGFSIFKSDSSLLNLNSYKNLILTMSADTNYVLNILLKTFENSITKLDNNHTYRFSLYTISVGKGIMQYKIPLHEFKTPQWWFKRFNTTSSELGAPNLKQVLNFDITNHSADLNRPGFFILHNCKLDKNLISLIIWIIIFSFLIVIILLGIYIRKRKQKSNPPSIISYKEQSIDKDIISDSDKVFKYIGEQYQDPALSLNTVAQQTAIHWAKISSIIKKEYQLTFKQYLNKIRITEAKRLLLETDRQITNIALTIGYNNVSHFNRIFKQLEGGSPSGFRKSKNNENLT